MQPSVSDPDRPHRALARTVCILLAAVVGGCSGNGDGFLPVVFERPETAVSYEVVLEGSPSDEITGLAERSLASYRQRDTGAASLAFLRRRAESDMPTLLKILRSRGYYSAGAGVTIEEAEPGTALVTITAEPGQAYTLTQHNLVIERAGAVAPPPLDAAALGSPVGDQALSAAIAAAEAAAVAELHKAGFPYAEFKGRSGLADPSTATLEVESSIAAGPAFTFGDVTFDGLETVDEAYLLSYLPWEAGQTFDAQALRKFQRLLSPPICFRRRPSVRRKSLLRGRKSRHLCRSPWRLTRGRGAGSPGACATIPIWGRVCGRPSSTAMCSAPTNG